MCTASSLPCVPSAAVTRITRCCSLIFDEFERVMRAVKKCFGNTKTLGNIVFKLKTKKIKYKIELSLFQNLHLYLSLLPLLACTYLNNV